MSDAEFARRALIAVGLAFAAYLVWQIAGLLLLLFGAIVLAAVFRAGGEGLARVLPLNARWGTALFLVLVVATLAGVTMFVGSEVGEQFSELRRRLPEAIGKLRAWLYENPFARSLLPRLEEAAEDGAVSGADAFRGIAVTVGAASHLFIAILIAVYLSLTPSLYLNGLFSLFPRGKRDTLVDALTVSGRALRRWLAGQLVAMVIVGVLTGVGLWLVGVPLALVLGLVAGLLEFIPFAGPFLAAIPGILLAFSVDPMTALYATLVYVIVQQLESALIMPLAQRWSVHLPPALGLFAIIVFGLLFGFVGVLLATPLAVVLMVLTQRLVVERH